MFPDAGACPSDDGHRRQGTIIKTTSQHSCEAVTRIEWAERSQSPTGTKDRARWCVFLTVPHLTGRNKKECSITICVDGTRRLTREKPPGPRIVDTSGVIP